MTAQRGEPGSQRTQRIFERVLFVLLISAASAVIVVSQTRPRARDLGITPGIYPPGTLNAITDVEGVRVGHTTVIEGDRVRTGVTAIVPHGGNVFQDKVAGAVFVGNAFGKLAGSTQVNELGTIETPVVLTNTLSVGVAMDAVVRYTIAQGGNEQVRSVNPLVGETNDGGLNDIRGLHVTREHVLEAIRSARTGAVAEGTVGAGTGTVCYGWKGGIGTSSRRLASDLGGYTVGVLAQTNFGGNLTIGGVPIYKSLQPPGRRSGAARPEPFDSPRILSLSKDERRAQDRPFDSPRILSLSKDERRAQDRPFDSPRILSLSKDERRAQDRPFDSPRIPSRSKDERLAQDRPGEGRAPADGSCMLVVATDAPLDARDLRRLAARAVFGLGRTGSSYSNGSGDFAIAFSTSPEMRSRFNETAARARVVLPTDATSPLFEAALEATEEAVYNSLFQATTVRSAIGTAEAIPVERVRELLGKR
ncbi:MAG: aminopeptidase [Acidobacteria bacterium]|nr:MAG: aminopeptidase [Acidobacteriota bacterium]